MISQKILTFLTIWIIENTEFSNKISAPQFVKLNNQEMSEKACFSSENCKVKAYYIKEGKIFYIDYLEPEKKICDQSIILH